MNSIVNWQDGGCTGWPLWLEKLEKLEKLKKGWFLRNQLEKLEKCIYFTTQAEKGVFF